MRPTSVWRCTRLTAWRRARWPTTSPGTTSCCSGCARPPGQAGPRTGDRWPSCVATTTPTTAEYVATLRAWLGAQGDPAEAGERLGVHENTVRYRLRKMAEITNLQLDDAKKRLAMMIELAATDTD